MKRIIFPIYLMIIATCPSFSQSTKDLEILDQFPNKQSTTYKVIDGDTLDMILFFPENTGKKKIPVVLFVHGGGWKGGDKYKVFKKPFLSAVKQLLGQGIAIASIEYRLTRKGLSTAFDCVVDCKDAARYLVKNNEKFNFDIDKMGVWGGSAGGHLALMTGLANNELFNGDRELENYDPSFKCIVSFYPMVTFIKPELNEGSNFTKPERFIPMLGGPLEENLELAKIISPVEYLQKTSPSTLLIHGDQDKILPVVQSRYFTEIAKEKNADVRYIEVEGADHSFRGKDISPTIQQINDTTARFFIGFLKEG